MIKIKFFSQENFFTGIECSGHSGYSVRGSDIICAGVSALMNALILGLDEVAGLDEAEIIRDERLALMRITWPVQESERISLLTNTIKESLRLIALENPRYIKIISQ